LLGIINDVLDFSKIDAGKLMLEQIDLDLVSLAEDVSTLFARQAHSKGVELTCLVEDTVPQLVRGDPLRLRQVLANLLGNAVKFTERGEVSVAVSATPVEAGQVAMKIAIRDTGIGMAPGSIATLFNSFTQADSSTTRKFGGTGLGLAITKGLVDAMHGSINVESAPGKGSTFTVTLPMQVGTPRARSRRADLSGFKVLIVDDNATNRVVLGHYLHALRVPHQMAASADEGLAYAVRAKQDAHPFDVIVLDYHMPDKNGVDFLRTLRTDPLLGSTKCIVLSSIGDRQAGTEALNIDAWLGKPVRQAQLYSALAMVTGVSSGWNATAAPALNPSTESGIRADARILLVEDNVVNQQVATRMLAAFGIKADIALNGLEALEYIKHNPFDLVFMDCQMPVMDGYQATEAVREWERVEGRTRVPIVAMTANAMQGDRERCLASGMDDYMAKPIRKDILTSVLARWLGGAIPSRPAAAEAVSPSLVEDEAVDPAIFQHLRELFDGDVDEVIDSYLQDSVGQLAVIAEALEQADIATVGRSAHSLKSSSRSIGALAVGKIAERLEAAVRSGGCTLEELKPICAELRSAHDVLQRRLDSMRAAPQRAAG
jgi:CheY-like chemotaxis protein/HPt (histidine-containing phosphotransfer) domain-containing protein/anti-sigma regulatory factor (Ser/Thr protein kinase)